MSIQMVLLPVFVLVGLTFVLLVWMVGARREAMIFLAAVLILFAVEWAGFDRDPGWGAWMAGTTFAVLTGLLIRQQIDLVAQLREAQAGLAERTRAEERNRIGRELHDVIAHTLTVSLLHITSARLAVEHDPDDAARALAEAERLSRESLDEVRLAVGTLHQHGDSGRTAPPVTCRRSSESNRESPGLGPAWTSARGLDRDIQPGIE